MVKTEILEVEVEDSEPIEEEKKVPILEELKLAVAAYRDIKDFSKSDLIISDDIGWHMIFGDIGWKTTSRIGKD